MKHEYAVRRPFALSLILCADFLFSALDAWSAPTTAPTSPGTAASQGVWALGGDFIVLKGLNVRSAPSAESDALGILPEGSICTAVERTVEEIELSGKTGAWIRIEKPVKGWVFGGFLEPVKAGSK
jgi:hypothetical protein